MILWGVDKRLRVGLVSAVEIVDPHRSMEHVGGLVQRQIFESLYRRSDGRSVPDLFARKLHPSAGGFEAPLREGVRFSDGTALSAELVCESLRRCPALPPELSVEAREGGLWISGQRGLAELCDILSSPMAAIVKLAGDEALGTGPFRVEERRPDCLILGRNPHHGSVTPSIDGIEFIAFGSQTNIAHAIARGELDYSSMIAPGELPKGSYVRKSYVPTPSTALLWINVERVPDVRVRQSIAHAIDKRRLLDLGYPGVAGLSAKGVTPPTLGSYEDQLEYDPRRSRELLAGAGDLDLHLLTIWGARPYLPKPMDGAVEVARQLAEVGLRVRPESVPDVAHWREAMSTGNYDLALGGWYADDPSLAFFLSAIYGSENVPAPGTTVMGCNFARWRDQSADRSLAQFRSLGSRDALDDLAERARAEVPVVALHHGATMVSLGPDVVGREFDELAFPVFSSFTLRRTLNPTPTASLGLDN